jgi:hypothetical protein
LVCALAGRGAQYTSGAHQRVPAALSRRTVESIESSWVAAASIRWSATIPQEKLIYGRTIAALARTTLRLCWYGVIRDLRRY